MGRVGEVGKEGKLRGEGIGRGELRERKGRGKEKGEY